MLRELAKVLGLTLTERELQIDPAPYIRLATKYELQVEANQPASYYIEHLIAKRSDFRKEKNWAGADGIRDSLAEVGTVIEDTPKGSTWRQGS